MKQTNQTYDIIAGIPSFNEQNSISFVAEQIDKGLKKYYPNHKKLIVDCDNGSTDKTKEVFSGLKTKVPIRFMETKKGNIGKGYALRMLLELAKKSKAKVVVSFDADLRSITPEWVKLQIDPILKGYGYITPNYIRYKYDATITNNICYPLTYGLFCHDIRQPIGGDIAFSSGLVDYLLNGAYWTKNSPLFGIDVFITANAILGGFKIAQSNLGVKIHKPKDPSKSLSPMFRQVISTLFKIIIENKERLLEFKKIKKVPILGRSKKIKPESFDVDIENTKRRFLNGFGKHKRIIKKCLSKEDFSKIKGCVHYNRIHVPKELWAKIVYDYILAFKKYESQSSTLLQSFTPIWFARIYTFIEETKEMNDNQAEKVVAEQAKEFFNQRHYLLDRL